MPITLKSTGGGSITLTTPSTASDYTLTFPAQNGTPITTLPGTSGNVLTSDGTNWTSAAVTSTTPVGSLISLSTNTTTATVTASGTGSVATITFTPSYTIPVGSQVYISGMTPTGYNGLWTITTSSAGSISFASTATGSQTVAGTLYPVPSGYLPCDGSVYTRTVYPALAAYIGTPIIASNPVVKYTNSSLVITGSYWGGWNNAMSSGVWAANGYLVMAGTTLAASSSASGVANAMFYSTDGITWTSPTSSYTCANMEYHLDAIAYGNGIYVTSIAQPSAGTSNYCVQYSSTINGAWSRAAVGVTGQGSAIYDIAFGGTGNVFLVYKVYDNCGEVPDNYYYSTNGSSWTSLGTVTNLTNRQCASIAAYSGGFVVCTTHTASNLWYSASGTGSWTDISSSISSPTTVYNVSYGNSKFVVRASNGIWTSTTGAAGTWTQVTSSNAYNGGFYCKLRWNGTVWLDSASGRYTKDLIYWGNNTLTCLVTGVVGTKGFNKVYTASTGSKYVQGYDFDLYNTSTQFPVPNTSISTGGSAVFIDGGAGQTTTTYIKT